MYCAGHVKYMLLGGLFKCACAPCIEYKHSSARTFPEQARPGAYTFCLQLCYTAVKGSV